MKENKIYSDKIIKGKRTYFFDINKSEQGHFYLKITESKKGETGFERHNLLLFEEDIKDFAALFVKTLEKFKELKSTPVTDEKKYSVENIRQTHQQAYLPWTTEDDSKLELLFCEGKKTKELAQIFGRKAGAINSRIKKLELQEKYGKL
ncbi:MAG: DUF3276 family protein [Bacteroidia bacterium]